MAGRHWLLVIFQVINYILILKGTKIISSEDIFSSMAFVFDTTGSMYDDYNQLRSHAEDIMSYVLKRNDSNIRHFVFVPFNDPVVGPVSESFVPSVIMHKINNIVVSGGGDCPEKGVTGVIEALKVVRPNSYIYVFTDASVKDFDKVPEALDLIQRKQVQVIVLKTGDNCLSEDSSYHSIASMGSGNVFDVQKNDVSKVLDFVKISMDTNRVNMLSVDIPISQLIPSPHKLNIDDSVKNLVVSVSGQTPNLDVINPVGKKLDESDGLMIDLDLPNVKIVTVIEPMPGEWTIFVASKSAHAIRVCGTSTKNFDYGFAITRPGSITHTSHRPLKGTNNYILVKYEDVQKYLSCEIKDLRSDGKFATLPIFNISKNMLLCGPFMPGNNPFYVQVFGKNNNGNFFKRITKTSITPDDPEKPYITTPKRVLVVAGEELRIICRIESLVPFNVAWNVLNEPSQFWKFNQSSEIELLVSNVTLNHSGTYDCNANNIAGSSNSSTIVEVVERPMIDGSSNDESIVIFEGEDFSTDCKGHGIPEPFVEWILKGTYIPAHSDHIFVINGTNRLVIYDATFNESNDYTCRVSNEYGMSEKHFRVTVRG
ncbi:hemicentin-1-like isoform X2 [Daktulosphaira vitifoliae]|nr:hemicentin-1-like isoform X2 [Daktulosphaira vitifoliae]